MNFKIERQTLFQIKIENPWKNPKCLFKQKFGGIVVIVVGECYGKIKGFS